MVRKRVFLKDISHKSGFTMNTVSRALHDKPDISQATKDKIKKIAHDMGYVPDAMAMSLRSGYSKTIGIMFDHLTNPYYMLMTNLIHELIKEVGYDVMIFTSANGHSKFELDGFNKMVSRRIDGIISFLKPNDEVVRSIFAANIPTVILGRNCEDIRLDFINTHDFDGGYLMGNYLLEKGHQKIAYIGGARSIDCSVSRFEGLHSALSASKFPLDPELVRFTDNTFSTVEKHLRHMIKHGATAILCYNDIMAFEAIDILHKMNLRIPEDIAICGYDHLQDFHKFPLKLTTIGMDKTLLVKKVVEVLFDKIEGRSNGPKYETLSVKLIEGMTA